MLFPLRLYGGLYTIGGAEAIVAHEQTKGYWPATDGAAASRFTCLRRLDPLGEGLDVEGDPAVRAGGIVRADLAFALGADQRQFRATGPTDGIVLTEGRAAIRAQGLPTSRAFRHARRDAGTAAGAGSARLEPTARTGSLLGQQQQAALWAEARPTLRAGALRRQKVGLADGTDRPLHELRPYTPGYVAGRCTRLVCDRLPAGGTAVGGAEERLTAGRTTAGEDEPTIGTNFRPGEEFHPATGADESQFQATFRTALSAFVYGGATARAQELPACGTGRVAPVDAGTALRAGQILALLRLWLRFSLRLLDLWAAFEDEAAVGAERIVWADLAVTAGTGQCPYFAARRAGGIVWADECAAGRAQVGVAVRTDARFGFERTAAAGAVRHGGLLLPLD